MKRIAKISLVIIALGASAFGLLWGFVFLQSTEYRLYALRGTIFEVENPFSEIDFSCLFRVLPDDKVSIKLKVTHPKHSVLTSSKNKIYFNLIDSKGFTLGHLEATLINNVTSKKHGQIVGMSLNSLLTLNETQKTALAKADKIVVDTFIGLEFRESNITLIDEQEYYAILIKEKYPEYQDIDNSVLIKKILDKYLKSIGIGKQEHELLITPYQDLDFEGKIAHENNFAKKLKVGMKKKEVEQIEGYIEARAINYNHFSSTLVERYGDYEVTYDSSSRYSGMITDIAYIKLQK